MRPDSLKFFRCPTTGSGLTLEAGEIRDGDVVRGTLVGAHGTRYRIEDGLPRFCESQESGASGGDRNHAYYQKAAGAYDEGMRWLFGSFFQDEEALRKRLVDLLDVRPGHTVLEVGCGTCRDSIHIASRIGSGGRLFLQDISDAMVSIGRTRFEGYFSGGQRAPVDFLVGDAGMLPFPDRTFDAVFHFGGLNCFGDKRRAFLEIARVVKVGGRVVCGDEGLAPWLRDTEYGQVLENSNPLYRHVPPLEDLPVTADDVTLHWVLGNAFYAIAFTVGAEPPRLDMDLPIPGMRGGTHRTRFHGKLEGVSPELRSAVVAAAQRDGKSVSEWLEAALRYAVEKR